MKEREIGYDFIRFFAMILIILHHFFTTCREAGFRFPSFLKNIIEHGYINFGGIGVALFFMLSGAVLIMTNRASITEFYKKRLIKIEIPQIIGFLFAFLATFIINKDIIHHDIIGIIISVLGLNYCGIPWIYFNIHTIWLIGEWFTAVIILLYVLFPLLKYLFNRFRLITTIAISIIFILNLKYKILSSTSGWFSITNGLMYFWLGCLFNEYKCYITKNIVIICNIILLGIIWFINPKDIFGYNYLPCFIFSVLLFIVLYRIKISNIFTNYICKYNYEIYLVHHRIYILFMPALLTARSNDLQIILAFILLTAIVFGASELLQKISNLIRKRIKVAV